jgi:hypothetical protein
LSGFPANKITEIKTDISPETASSTPVAEPIQVQAGQNGHKAERDLGSAAGRKVS